jgi:Putative transposase.
LKDRSLLSDLFHSVRDVILRLFSKMNRSENFTPGFIAVLHTFGRDLKWNPHIHVLVSEGAAGNRTPWRKVSHFNFNFLRFAFRTALLDHLAARLGPSFNPMKSLIYKRCPKGFYVYAKPNVCNPHQVANYIGRYLGRPVIATSRIDSYDGQSVTFHYNRHEDGVLVHETLSAMDFIKRLIRHIPDKHFKMIRYYGLYAKHHPQMPYFRYAIHPGKRKILRSFNRWRDSIALSFGLDPLLCSCGHTMNILEIYHHHTALFHHYLKYLDSS